VGLLALGLVLDLLSLVLDGGGVYLEASLYVLTGAAGAAVLAAIPGLADLFTTRRDSRSRKLGLTHLILMLLVVGATVFNVWLRWGPWEDSDAAPDARVSGWGLLISLVAFGLLGLGAYLGGRLVYGDGIGVGRHRRFGSGPEKTIRASTEGSPDGFVAVAPEEYLREGETLRVEVDGVVMTVARTGGEVYAFQEFCTHRFGPLSEGRVHDRRVTCPWHRSSFNVLDGEVVSGPAKMALPTYHAKVERGEIRVSSRRSAASSPGFPQQPPGGSPATEPPVSGPPPAPKEPPPAE
jgi:nitrite reductase/ring-hydroxylating ferredoxin subunit/uncharacterized membrane protein